MSSESEVEVALLVSDRLKTSSKRACKQNIRRAAPLRSPLKATAAAAAVTDKQWLQQCEELYDSLPKNSRWAKHKLKVCLEPAGNGYGQQLGSVSFVSDAALLPHVFLCSSYNGVCTYFGI